MISSILCTKYRTLVPVAETAITQLSFSQLFPFPLNSKIQILLKVLLWIICVVSPNISNQLIDFLHLNAFPF